MERISICIPAYNAAKTIKETLDSCIVQHYPYLEIIVSDNCSTDDTAEIVKRYPQVKLITREKTGTPTQNGNNAIKAAAGKYIVLMCADDVFTTNDILRDIVKVFQNKPKVGYVGRYYYQFIDNPKVPIRGFRHNNPYRSADNWSGVAFRAECMPLELSEEIFVEAAYLVKQITDKGWDCYIMKYDTIAVRTTIGDNGSQKSFCYIKSPLKNWIDCIGKEYTSLTNFVSLVQIKNWGTFKALLREIWYFIKYKPSNLFRPDFWFFSIITLITPKIILKQLPKIYKLTIGKLITKKIQWWESNA